MKLRQLSRLSIAGCTVGLALMLGFGALVADEFRRHLDAIERLDTLQARISRLGVNVNRLVDRDGGPLPFAQMREDLGAITGALERITHADADDGVRLAARIRAGVERLERDFATGPPGERSLSRSAERPAALEAVLAALRRDEAALTAMESRILHEYRRTLGRRIVLAVAGFGGLAFLFGGLCIFAFTLLHGRISGPVQALTAAVREAQHGQLRWGVPVTTGDDEFANLARAFNAMLARQREHEAEREQAEQAQASTLAILRTQQEVSPDGILVMDGSGEVISCNRRFAEVWDLPPAALEACATRQELLALLHERMADPGAFLARVEEIYAQASERSDDEVELADGRILERHSAPMTVAGGDNIGRVWFFRDITVQKRAEARLNRLAYEDPLTGLPTRAGFARRLEQRLGEMDAARAGGYLVVLGLRGLNDINQAYGYEVGDGLVAAVGERLAGSPHAAGCAGRLGGDQFGLLLVPEHEPFSGPEDVVRRVDGLFSTAFEIGDNSIRIDAWLGIVALEPSGQGHEEALRRGLLALHTARAREDVHWAAYSPAMDTAIRERIRVTEGLRGAVERGELELHYQPKVRLADGQVIAAEALLRWRHPSDGLQPPDAFIPIAERSRMIVPIGEWVLRAACERLRVWQAANLSSVRVAVNVSVVQLVHTDFAETVGRILAETGTDPDALSLEVTESVFERQPAALLEQMQRLHAMGVRLALDDFGTGYSSLSYLHAYPFDEIKVDKAFVQTCTTQDYSREIVDMVIRVAAALGCEAVAEGIETDAHRELLLRLGCRTGQGYFYSRPLAQEQFEQQLACHSRLPLGDARGARDAG